MEILGAMNWTLQRPAKQAKERNQEARQQWIAERWPAVKKTPSAGRRGSFPGRKWHLGAALGERTWAPKGKTPVLIHAFNWKKMSVCAALGYRWDGRRCRLWFQTRPGATTRRV